MRTQATTSELIKLSAILIVYLLGVVQVGIVRTVSAQDPTGPLAHTQQDQLTASDGAANDHFGNAVAISNDTAVVGAVRQPSQANRGGAYVFVRNGTSWLQQQKLLPVDVVNGDLFGTSVAIDGDTIVAGAPSKTIGGSSGRGAAYVFVRSGTTWTQQQQLIATDGAMSDNFGAAVAISGDTIVVGALNHAVGANSRQGAAYVFVRNGSTWTQQQKLTANDGLTSDQLGGSVALVGNTAVVGARENNFGANRNGKVYVFLRSGTTWSQQQKLTASDGSSLDAFGGSVAISNNTDTIAVGAPDVNEAALGDRGSVYVFVRSGTTWSQQQRLLGSLGLATGSGAHFGSSVDVDGDTLIAGAPELDPLGGNGRGAVYLFDRSGSTWTEHDRFLLMPAVLRHFGTSVAMSGNSFIGGAPFDTVGSSLGQGSAYVFSTGHTLSIADVSVAEGNSGPTQATFTITLSSANTHPVVVNYATTDGTANAGSDYVAASGTLTFNPGETSKILNVPINGDTLFEADETFFVDLSNPVNANLLQARATGTITNDDPLPTENLKISGRVVDNSALGISGQLVILGGAASGSTITDSNGNYSFANLSAGNYTVTPSSGNYSFSPTTYSFNNLSVDRIANFVGTQTVVGITGRVTDSNDIGLGSVTLGLSMNGTLIGTMSTDFLGNYGFGNLPAGANYVVTPVGSFSPSSLFFNSLSTNATADFKAVPSIPPTSAAISGRAADANNNPLANITVTLSGPVTRVASTDAAGNYSFANLTPGGNFAVTIQSSYFVFAPSRADFSNLSGSQTFNFTAAPVVVPSPLPPPSDDFNSPTRDPNKWNLGLLTQPPTSFDPLVNVAQINGQLVITPLAQVSGLHYNGYVSANSFDLRGGSVSVELVQAATGGADTIFAIGSDSDNFYRFMVHTAGPVPTTSGRDGIEKPSNTAVAQLLFQVNVGGVLTALSIPYDPLAHRFMRFRHEAPANAIVFETSPDNIAFVERHRVVLSRSVSALTAELSAGTSSPTNPGTAVFDNFGLVTSTFQFSSASYTVEENGGSILITVTRAGSTTAGMATVDYATSDGTALQTSDYIIAAGRLTFAPGEVSKTFRLLIIDDVQAEGNQNLNLLLQAPVGSGLNTPGRAVLTINDNDTTAATSNPLEEATFFVTQHYLDFLNREPDTGGLAFWVNEITSCGTNAQCIELKRINVSAAYFLSIEFQETGLFVIRSQRAAFGRKSDTAASRFRYQEFTVGARQVGAGVVVGQSEFEQTLEGNKQAYATQVATSAAFIARFPLSQTAAAYVDALFASAMVSPTVAERDAAITAFGGGDTAGRVAALRSVTDSNSLRQAEFNAAFVLMQYYGYLRRNPTDPPDSDDSGYQFWLTKLNQFNGNFVNADMVKAFSTSGEYRHRFGP